MADFNAYFGFVLGLLLGAQLTFAVLHYRSNMQSVTVRSAEFGLYSNFSYGNDALYQLKRSKRHFDTIVPVDSSRKEANATLVVMILSSPSLLDRRNGIRETWLRDAAALNVIAKFLIGTAGLSPEELGALTAERERYNDMVLLPDLKESFTNLSLKVLKGVVWAYEHVNFEYFMKTDDDLYIRLDQAIAAIHNMKPEYRGHIYWGYFAAGIPQKSGKYKDLEWKRDRKCPNYFPYAYGASYIVAQSALSLVARLSAKLYTGYLCEDTSMGSWLAPFDLVRIHDLRFTFSVEGPACNPNYIASHLHNPESLHNHYERLKKKETLCDDEILSDQRWVYDWTGPPQSCCRNSRDIQRNPFGSSFSAFKRNDRHLVPFIEV